MSLLTLHSPHLTIAGEFWMHQMETGLNSSMRPLSPVREAVDGAGNSLKVARTQANVAPTFPVSAKEFSKIIQGNQTDFILCSYDDYIFVLATQLGKMGTLLQARKEEGYGAQVTFNVSVLLGKHDEPMLRACARQLIERISGVGSSRPLLLSLGLKDHSRETLKDIIEAVCENKVW